MSLEITGPTPIATPPPPLLAWAQKNAIGVMALVVFGVLHYSKKPRRRKRRRKR